MSDIASVFSPPTYHSLSDICLGSCCTTTSTYLVTVEFLLWLVSKCKIEILLFVDQDIVQVPVHDTICILDPLPRCWYGKFFVLSVRQKWSWQALEAPVDLKKKEKQ